jgi:retinol dehydrogenase 12
MNESIKEIQDTNKDAKVSGFPLDLGDASSIDDFVDSFLKLNTPLHILINNAGVMATKDRKVTKDNFEYQFGINHLGHFRLTMKLLPLMVKTSKDENCECRIVNLSSSAHTMGTKKINFDDIHFEKKGAYKPWTAYGQSKLSNIMFSNELSKRLKLQNVNVTVNSLHPGVIATELSRDLDTASSLMWSIGKLAMKTIPQGAATTVYCATSEELIGKTALYFSDCNEETPLEYSSNEKAMQQLFELSEKETGISFPKFE